MILEWPVRSAGWEEMPFDLQEPNAVWQQQSLEPPMTCSCARDFAWDAAAAYGLLHTTLKGDP